MPENLAPASVPVYTPTRSSSKIRAVGIVVLARNHSETIPKCIAGIFAANNYSGWHNSLWIVVVADSCTDDTAKAARNALGAFEQVLEVSAHSRQVAHQIVVKHHVKEEEQPSGMFAEAKKSKMDLQLLGEQLSARKKELGFRRFRVSPPR